MASRVADKAAFYEEVSEIIRPRGQEAPESTHDFGELQGVAVSGDSASGWVVWSRKEGRRIVRLLRKFRRVDGRWFNDDETWDYTPRRADEAAAQAPPGYASPREAFEARRKALARRDLRTAFASLTPAAQGREVENLVGEWVLMDGGGARDPGAVRQRRDRGGRRQGEGGQVARLHEEEWGESPHPLFQQRTAPRDVQGHGVSGPRQGGLLRGGARASHP